MIDDLIYRLQDKHVDLKRVQEAIRSRAGDIRDQINAYQTEELFHGRTAERVNAFLEGDLNPLLTEMRARGVELDEIGKYLWVIRQGEIVTLDRIKGISHQPVHFSSDITHLELARSVAVVRSLGGVDRIGTFVKRQEVIECR